MKKKIISSVLLTAMAFGAASAFAEELPMVTSASDEVIVGVPQITVDGEKLDLSKLNLSQYMYTEKENTLVPLRAVAEKMGYKVEWDNTDKAVTVSDDDWQVVLNIGVDSYYGVTKIKDAVGMTAPQSYGAAPKLIDDTTFVPAKMFELMGYEFSALGQYASFTKAGASDDNAVQIPNPLVSYDSIEAAAKVLGFTPNTPSYIPEGFEADDISVIGNELLQIIYTDKNGSRISYRTAKGTEDISGDYTAYDIIETVKINDCDVILKGNNNLYYNASWIENDNAYSVTSSSGLEKETMTDIAEYVK